MDHTRLLPTRTDTELDVTIPNPNLYGNDSDRPIGPSKRRRPFTATLAAAVSNIKGRYPPFVAATAAAETKPQQPQYQFRSDSIADESLYTRGTSIWTDYKDDEDEEEGNPLLQADEQMSLVYEVEEDNSSYTEVTVSSTSEITEPSVEEVTIESSQSSPVENSPESKPIPESVVVCVDSTTEVPFTSTSVITEPSVEEETIKSSRSSLAAKPVAESVVSCTSDITEPTLERIPYDSCQSNPAESSPAVKPVPESVVCTIRRSSELRQGSYHRRSNDEIHPNQPPSPPTSNVTTTTSTISSRKQQPWTDTLTMDLLLQSTGRRRSKCPSFINPSPTYSSDHSRTPKPLGMKESDGRDQSKVAARPEVVTNVTRNDPGDADEEDVAEYSSIATSRAVGEPISRAAAQWFQCANKTTTDPTELPPEMIFLFSEIVPSSYDDDNDDEDNNHSVCSTLTHDDERPQDLVERAILELMRHPPSPSSPCVNDALLSHSTLHHWIQKRVRLGRRPSR